VTARPISRETARLFLARRHLLAPPRSLPAGREGVLAVSERLGSVQFDPLEVAGRNHDLVLAARVAEYRREMTDALLYDERRLFEAYNKGLSLLPTHELPWFRQTWDRRREGHEGDTFQTHRALVEEILERIRREGPLSSIDFEAREAIDWYWRPTNQVRAILEALAESGILGFARRQGNRRYYDLAERLFPAELLAQRLDPIAQRRHRLLSRFRGHGMLGRSGSAELWLGTAPGKRSATYDGPVRLELVDQLVEAGELVPVAIGGVRGGRYVIAAETAILDAAERDATAVTAAPATGTRDDWRPLDPERAGVAMLAPLDPLVWDRELLRTLYGFDYLWEVYIPERKRQWGYYVLPLFWGDRFVGRIEPRIDRPADAVRILNVYWEDGFAPRDHPAFLDGLAEALDAHRRFAGVGRVLLSRAASGVALRRDLDGRLAAVGRPARRSVRPSGASGRRRAVVGR
jgi:uncharacterized protein YcaQ